MKNTWRPLLLLLVLMGLALSGTQAVRSQSTPPATEAATAAANAAPPHVIATTPAQQEIVNPDAMIQIVFDQPMDQASVEKALSLSPDGAGAAHWSDASTLSIAPTRLQHGQQYTLTIDATAKSAAGAALEEPYQLIFKVVSNPSVSQVVPAPDSKDIQAQASVTVVFDRPIVPLVTTADQSTLPQPLTFSPAVDGTGEWVGTAIYVFKPKTAFAGGTLYTATVDSNLKDVNGDTLGTPYTWKFTTIAPRIEQIYPQDGDSQVTLDTGFTVTFNQPMDHASTTAAFTVRNITNGSTVAGTIAFDNNDTTLAFTPTSPLELGTRYQMSILASARSASGSATLTNPTTETFSSVPYPAVAATSPTEGQQVQPGGGVGIQFTAPMDFTTFANKIHIDPKPDNMSFGGGGNNLFISFPMLPATKYTITLDAGSADPYGNKIKEPFTLHFTTLDLLPSLGLATRDVVAVTNAYRPDTTIIAAGVNVKTVQASLSSLELPDFFKVPWNYGYPDLSNYQPPRVTRQWTIPIDAKTNTTAEIPLKLAGDQGGALAPGVYFLQVSSPETFAPNNPPLRQFVVVATANLTVKVTPDEAFVWVTDMKSGQPLSNVQVSVYDMNHQPLASGTTDASGIMRAKINTDEVVNGAPIWATASGNGVFSIGSSAWTNGNEPYNFKITQEPRPQQNVIYLYTDQPVVRPAHPVYFRGIVRNQNDTSFAVPAGQPVTVTITDAQGKQVYNKTLTLNGFGSFNDKYEPPQDAAIGQYNIQAHYQNEDFSFGFQVSDFRPPEFLVTTKAQSAEVVAGDTINVDVNSTFFSGGPVSNAQVTWTAIANQGNFNYTGDGSYDFDNYGNGDYVYNRQVAMGQGTLDAQGHYLITLPADLGGYPVTQTFTIEANVTDINNQVISGRTDVTVHPAKLYVGLAPAAYVGQAGKPLDVKVIAVDWASTPQPNQTVTMTVVERRWQQDPNTLAWSETSIPVTDGKVTTDDKGQAVFTFTPPRAGIYEIDGQTRDSGERIAQSSTTVWVAGPQFVPWNSNSNNLVLVADKKQYTPGDTASVLIASPFPEPVQALVTVERAGIMKAEVVTITGSYTYQLPLDMTDSPNVYIAVALMRGSGDDPTKQFPEIRYGLLNLTVAVKQQLQVKITPSSSTAKPGDTVKFDVFITDLDGKPVAAEVGLSLSDLANLSVGTDTSGSILDAFWHARGLSVVTGSALSKLIDDLTVKDVEVQNRRDLAFAASPSATDAISSNAATLPKTGGGGIAAGEVAQDGAKDESGAAAAPPTPRTNFVDTPLWVPDLVTGDDGHATASVTLPDNLTTWRLDARAISKDTYVGTGTVDVISTKPLLVRPSTPRFFVVGDEAELAVVVNNNTDQDLSTKVSLDAKGVTLSSDATQTVTIPKQGRVRVSWMATVGDVDNVDLTFTAIGGDQGQYSDASKPEVGLGDQRLLPVYRYLAPDFVATAGVLTQPGQRTEAVIVPSATAAPTGELTIKINPSLAATTIDGLTYLENYPYQCTEQTVSKFLPNIITFRALQKLHLDNPTLRANLDTAVTQAIARLQREQHSDGGWGWFPSEESNPLTSAYALLGLIEAKAADEKVDLTMLVNATAYVMSDIPPINDRTEAYILDRTAFVAYILTRADQPNISVLDSLYTQRERMNIFARAFLAQSYGVIKGDQNKINTLLSDLQTNAIVSATGTHWEEKYRDWWNWDSDTRTTAIVLKTLVDLDPQSQLIPNIVRWLMVARRGDAWETTQETAWSVMALTDWMDVSGELKADYAYTVNVNGSQLGSGQANADTLRDTKTLQLSVTDMLRDQANKVVIDHGDGAGSLYYTATLQVNQPVEQVKPTNRGFGVTRTYLLNKVPVTGAQIGDVITVALEISLDSDMYYVNIEDPIPAGTEIVDQSLQTTSQVGQPPELDQIDPYEGGWGWWWFSNTEIHPEKIVLSASYLPRGTYRYVYQIRASSTGTYKVMPATAQEFYFPEVFGRSDGSLFTVKDAPAQQ